MRLNDISGQRFGRLTAVSFVRHENKRKSKWLCACDCGATTTVFGYSLKNGETKSCGCLRKEVTSIRSKIHGHSHSASREYQVWGSMIKRCENPNTISYPLYGGRGITVCERWRKSFVDFLDDMGARPDGTTLDRIDGTGNYTPDNCRWATDKEQAANRTLPASRAPRPIDVKEKISATLMGRKHSTNRIAAIKAGQDMAFAQRREAS